MKTVKEIKALKCPNNECMWDDQHFVYETTGRISLNKDTRCLRCGYPKSQHKDQKRLLK